LDEQIFSDGIGTITVIGATVRLDFVALSPTERDPNGQPKAVFKQRIVMGVDGFMRSASKVQEAVQALSKMGAMQTTASPAPAPSTISGRSEESIVEPTLARGVEPAVPAQQRTGAAKPPFP